jgi:hypothetical protein
VAFALDPIAVARAIAGTPRGHTHHLFFFFFFFFFQEPSNKGTSCTPPRLA